MCDFGVTESLILGAVVSAAGTGLSAYSQYQQGQTQAKIAERNAQAAEYAAQYQEKVGAIEAKKKRQEIAQIVGRERAAAAASGVDVNSGSVLTAQIDTQTFGELDAQEIQHNYALKAWGLRNQAANYSAEASAASTGSMYAAAGSLMSGVSPLVNSYVKYKMNS